MFSPPTTAGFMASAGTGADPVSHEHAGADVDVAVEQEHAHLDARVPADRALPGGS